MHSHYSHEYDEECLNNGSKFNSFIAMFIPKGMLNIFMNVTNCFRPADFGLTKQKQNKKTKKLTLCQQNKLCSIEKQTHFSQQFSCHSRRSEIMLQGGQVINFDV